MTDMQQVKAFLLELVNYVGGVPDLRERIAAWEPGEETAAYEPYEATDGTFSWFNADRIGADPGGHSPSEVPGNLFLRMTGYTRVGDHDRIREYPTRTAALNALAAAKSTQPA